MKVRIVFHGVLKKYAGNMPELETVVPEGTTVEQVIAKTAVPLEEISFAAVNGSRAPLSTTLHEGDEVKIFQFVAGG